MLKPHILSYSFSFQSESNIYCWFIYFISQNMIEEHLLISRLEYSSDYKLPILRPNLIIASKRKIILRNWLLICSKYCSRRSTKERIICASLGSPSIFAQLCLCCLTLAWTYSLSHHMTNGVHLYGLVFHETSVKTQRMFVCITEKPCITSVDVLYTLWWF